MKPHMDPTGLFVAFSFELAFLIILLQVLRSW